MIDEGQIAGAAGRRLAWRSWVPERDAASVVVISHGVAEHGGRYAHVAAVLAEHGHAVYALDHQGHGRSDGHRALIDRLDTAVADLSAFVAFARGHHESAPAVLLGHSLGGAVALAYVLDHQSEIDALVLSAPLAALESASPVTRAIAAALSIAAPRVGVHAIDASAISRDPEVVQRYRDDPLVFDGKVPARTLAELAAGIRRFGERLPELRLPILLLHGDADSLVPLSASRLVHERAGSADKELRVYPGLYHEVLNEPEWPDVASDLLGWLDARTQTQSATA
jgi:alpha-beta hydrolase superfamily lysophospholipase